MRRKSSLQCNLLTYNNVVADGNCKITDTIHCNMTSSMSPIIHYHLLNGDTNESEEIQMEEEEECLSDSSSIRFYISDYENNSNR